MRRPLAETWAVQAGKPMSRSSRVSRSPAPMTSPRTPCAASEVASSSPKAPSLLGETVVTTMMSPGRACSTAAWIIRLSPGQQITVSAVPAMRAPCWLGRIPGPR